MAGASVQLSALSSPVDSGENPPRPRLKQNLLFLNRGRAPWIRHGEGAVAAPVR